MIDGHRLREKIRAFRWFGQLHCIYMVTKSIWYYFLELIFRLYPITRRKVLICNTNQRESNVITNELLNERVHYDIVWAVKENEKGHIGVRTVKQGSIRYVFELMTAGIWIDNSRKEWWVWKRKGQLYFQTWHGAVCLKNIERDAERYLFPYDVIQAKHDSKMIDYMIAETRYMYRLMKTVFWYNGRILKGELKDGLGDSSNLDAVKNNFGNGSIDHYILYVPTFRKDERTDCYNIEFDRLLDAVENKYGGKWGAIVRLHVNVASKSEYLEYSNRVFNGTDYPMLTDLINLSEIVITDYSSCMFFAYRAQKKVLLYTPDIDEYLKNDRGSYFSFDELPSPITKSTDELIASIISFDDSSYYSQIAPLVRSIGFYDNDIMLTVKKIMRYYVKGTKRK